MLKKKILFVIASTILIVFIVFTYIQIIKPLSVKNVEYKISTLGYYGISHYKEIYPDDKILDYDEQYIRKNDRFPSDENSDYCQLSLHFTIDNRSLLSQNNITGIILCEDENSPIIIKRENAFNGEIDPMTKKTIMCMLFLIYKGNMSDEELISYMKEQTVVLSYQSDLKIGTIKLKLSDFDLNQYDGDDSEK